MEINRQNYEAYLLDLLEGRLPEEDQQRLHEFLLLNPDCNTERSELEPWFLVPGDIHFPEREKLKREWPEATSMLTRDNFDLFSIARMEGDLSREQEEAHQRMVSEDIQKYRQWSEWQHTRLVPERIVFKDRKILIRRRGLSRRIIWMSVGSAAATLALLFILLRMVPVSSTGDLTLHPNPVYPAQTTPDFTKVPEIPTDGAETLEVRANRESSILPGQKPAYPLILSVVKEHDDPSPENSSEMVEVSPDDLRPGPVRMQDHRGYISSLVSNPLPDQIKPLDIPPVSIHLRSLSIAQISGLDVQEIVKDYSEEKDLSLWTIANAGFKGINRIAGSEISLLASRDEEGDVSGFQLKAKRFSMTRPIGREE
jgi:hypothetical protein